MDPDRRKKPVTGMLTYFFDCLFSVYNITSVCFTLFTVNGPYIVYMLHENEILDDWTAIKKSLTQRKIHDGKLLAAR